MNAPIRSTIGSVLLVLAGLFAALTLGSAWFYHAQSSAYREAAAQLETTERLARDIIHLRQLPQLAALRAASMENTAQRIEQAARQAGLPPTALLRVQPQSSSRLGNSPYQVHPTRLELRDITLPQLNHFCSALEKPADGLIVRDLRLWSLDSGATGNRQETWSAEVVLTQLIFSPITR